MSDPLLSRASAASRVRVLRYSNASTMSRLNTCTVTDVNSETRPGQYSHAVHHDTSGACGFCDEHESKLVLGWPSVSTDAAVVVVGCARTAKVPCLLGEVAER